MEPRRAVSCRSRSWRRRCVHGFFLLLLPLLQANRRKASNARRLGYPVSPRFFLSLPLRQNEQLSYTVQQCFGQYFDIYGDPNVQDGNSLKRCYAGVGLYQWQQPFVDDEATSAENWDNGYCVGYQESMLSVFSDTVFEAARGFGVFAVLLSFVMFIWTLMLSCVQMNRCQVWLYRISAFFGFIATCLTFLMNMSGICTDESIFDGGGARQSCEIYSGGYAMIAGAIMWFVTFVLSLCWIRPADQVLVDDLGQEVVGVKPEGGRRAFFFGRNNNKNGNGANSRASTRRSSRPTSPQTPPRQIRMPSSATSLPTRMQSASRDDSLDDDNNIPAPQSFPGAGRNGQRQEQSRSSTSSLGKATKKKRTSSRVTVDDVTRLEEMEVYLSRSGQGGSESRGSTNNAPPDV